jgi:HPt (histidine-containing phosphotransfer) domain-containing protein
MKTDLTYLNTMSDGNKQIVIEIIELFIEQVKEIGNEMLKNHTAKDYESLSRLAHKAKSTVSIVGMHALLNHLIEFELITKDGIRKEDYLRYINIFIEETEGAVKELNEYLRKKYL